jgi:hypothetical protein
VSRSPISRGATRSLPGSPWVLRPQHGLLYRLCRSSVSASTLSTPGLAAEFNFHRPYRPTRLRSNRLQRRPALRRTRRPTAYRPSRPARLRSIRLQRRPVLRRTRRPTAARDLVEPSCIRANSGIGRRKTAGRGSIAFGCRFRVGAYRRRLMPIGCCAARCSQASVCSAG